MTAEIRPRRGLFKCIGGQHAKTYWNRVIEHDTERAFLNHFAHIRIVVCFTLNDRPERDQTVIFFALSELLKHERNFNRTGNHHNPNVLPVYVTLFEPLQSTLEKLTRDFFIKVCHHDTHFHVSGVKCFYVTFLYLHNRSKYFASISNSMLIRLPTFLPPKPVFARVYGISLTSKPKGLT